MDKKLYESYKDRLIGYKHMLTDIDLTQDHIIESLANHVSTHRWLVNKEIPFTITFDQAIYSWYENVYRPIMCAVRYTGILPRFIKGVKDQDTYETKIFNLIMKISDIMYSHKGNITHIEACWEAVKLLKMERWFDFFLKLLK